MKSQFILLACVFLFFNNKEKTDYYGEVTYTTLMKEYKVKNPKTQDFLENNVFGKTSNSILSFNNNESIFYTENKKLKNDVEVSNINLVNSIAKIKGLYYFNSKTNLELHQLNAYGENFVIKSVRDTINWKLTKETKKIGEFHCFRALAEIPIKNTVREGAVKKIEAWYANNIPINLGPAEYFGLPGLILEINTLEIPYYSIRASVIKLNPKENIIIKRPKKGINISMNEFLEIGKKAYDKKKGSFNFED